jgi:putative spermidine/putrescine transport system permease protein
MSIALSKDQSRRPGRNIGVGVDKIVLTLTILYLLLPLAVTLVFGLSGGGGLSFSTYQQIFRDHDFSLTLFLSLGLAFSATILSIVLVTPTAYWVQMRLPNVRPLMDVLSLVPFAVPAVLLSLGLVEVYGSSNPIINVVSLGLVPLLSNNPFNIVNTPQLLVCAYVIISLPFVYRPIDNSLRAINTRVLTEAAYSLGSGWWRTFLTIILPNIAPGIISAALLTFSTAMGEFTIASLFGLYTFPIYLDETGQSSPYKAASLSVLSFILTLICVLAIILLVRRVAVGPKQGEIEVAAAK